MGAVNSNSNRGWQEVDLKNLLSSPALGIGAGSVTDTGFAWTLSTDVENPIVLSAGIPDRIAYQSKICERLLTGC